MPDDLDRLIRDLGRMSGSARVGALDEENARKLLFSEFGTPTADPRPALSVTTNRARKSIERAVDKRLGAVLDGKERHDSGREMLGDVGRALAEQVQEVIDSDVQPDLAKSTLSARRRRGQGERTLVASGEMLRSIKAEASDDVDAWPDDD